jgi:exodeoxyribonuclease V beta subunit
MRHHNYGLQYWLYSLVLHQYLGNHLTDYSHDNHFGGVLYLFVRGMHPAMPGNGIYFDRPDSKTLEELAACLGGREDE